MRAFSFGVTCSYATRQEIQVVSSFLGCVVLLLTFFTASLAAAMVEDGTTIDSELFGLGRTELITKLEAAEVQATSSLNSEITSRRFVK